MTSIIVQQPQETAQQLFLLFHGVGADPTDLLPVAHVIAKAFPQAMVVSVAAPHDCDLGQGLQWFSVKNVTEENRAQRLQQALPSFLSIVQHWQGVAQVEASATALIGFSQGAIMALEASKSAELVVGRVIAHSGRYVTLPSAAHELLTIHLIHGKADAVIPYCHTVDAAEALQTIAADFTADVLPFLGHTMNDETVAIILNRLQSHVPKRLWDEALQAAKALKS